MAEPKFRFKKDNGESFPAIQETTFGDIYFQVKEKNDGTYGKDNIISVANMYFKSDVMISDDEYLKTYNVCRLGDIAYEGNKSKHFAFGRLVENDIGDGIVSHVFVVFRPKDNKHNLTYWKYAINNECVMGRILARCTKKSTMMTDIVPADFLKQKMNVPCLEEQQKIADLLSTVDELISTITEEVRLWEEKKKGVIQKIFSQEVRFKDETGEDYPDWETILLKDGCEFITVGIANSATHAYRNNGIVMFRNQNIKENHLDDSEILYIDSEFEKKYKNKRLKENDLLVTRTGYPGIACIVPKKYEGAQTFTTLIVRLEEDCLLPEYACQCINSPNGKKYIESTQIGGGQKNAGAGILENMPIMLPSLAEQQKIADCLSSIDEVIKVKKQKLETWKNIKKGLLQQMFV